MYPGVDALTEGSVRVANGVVFATGGGRYRVRLEAGDLVEAAFRGRLKLEGRTGDKVVVGDRVTVALVGERWVVDSVGERSTEMVRSSASTGKAKVVAANLDRVLAVVAAREPDSSLELVDRLLAVSEASGVRPVLVVNKIDLEGGLPIATSLAALYRSIGYAVFPVSARTRAGLDALSEEVRRGTSALIGPSGAGKSSLLNALDPDLDLRVGDLSRKTGRGRHTTVGSRLVPLACGGLVADTPGFGDVGLWRVAAEDVEACFPEIAEHAGGCRFRGCAHLAEPDCAVLAAVASGAIAATRYQSYVKLRTASRE